MDGGNNLGEGRMSDAVETAGEEHEKKGRRSLLLLLLLLLLGGAIAVYFLFFRGAGGTEFSTSYKGCDQSGACAEFTVYAPGIAYAWDFGRAQPRDVPEDAASFADKLKSVAGDAETIIVAGLASQENTNDFNAYLSACRAHRFDGLVREALGDKTPDIRRMLLGRYEGGSTPTDQNATEIQRLMVVAFVKDADENVNLAEALKEGSEKVLAERLKTADEQVAAQLDFTKYHCWKDGKLEAVKSGERTKTCYTQRTSKMDLLCAWAL